MGSNGSKRVEKPVAELATGEWTRYESSGGRAFNIACEDEEAGAWTAPGAYSAHLLGRDGHPTGLSISGNLGAERMLALVEAWAAAEERGARSAR